MSRDRDRARVALEFLGEWFNKGIEPQVVANCLMSIDSSLLPISDASQIDTLLKTTYGLARPGPLTTTGAGHAWLRAVIEEAIAFRAVEAEIDGYIEDVDDPLPQGPLSIEEFRASADRYQKRRMDHYDCLDVGGDNNLVQFGLVRLFGQLNIGNLELTSMQVGGLLASSQASVIDHWYARTDARGADLVALEQWLEGANAILNVGDHPAWIKPLSVLLRERPWVPPARRGEALTPEELAQFEAARAEGAEPIIVPVRQHMDITVALPRTPAPVRARVWVHVEGLMLREIR